MHAGVVLADRLERSRRLHEIAEGAELDDENAHHGATRFPPPLAGEGDHEVVAGGKRITTHPPPSLRDTSPAGRGGKPGASHLGADRSYPVHRPQINLQRRAAHRLHGEPAAHKGGARDADRGAL